MGAIAAVLGPWFIHRAWKRKRLNLDELVDEDDWPGIAELRDD